MARGRVVKGLVLAVLTLTAAGPAAAQAKVELTPFFTSFFALANVNDNLDLGVGSGCEPCTERQFPGPGAGGRLTYWIGSTIGIEGAGAYIITGTRATSDALGSVGVTFDGTIVTGGARVLYRPPRSNFHLLGGIGIVSRSGDTWDGFEEGLTTIGGTIGFGARAAVTPKLSFDIRVESNLYSFEPKDTDGSTGLSYEAKLQADVLVAIGVPLTLAR